MTTTREPDDDDHNEDEDDDGPPPPEGPQDGDEDEDGEPSLTDRGHGGNWAGWGLVVTLDPEAVLAGRARDVASMRMQALTQDVHVRSERTGVEFIIEQGLVHLCDPNGGFSHAAREGRGGHLPAVAALTRGDLHYRDARVMAVHAPEAGREPEALYALVEIESPPPMFAAAPAVLLAAVSTWAFAVGPEVDEGDRRWQGVRAWQRQRLGRLVKRRLGWMSAEQRAVLVARIVKGGSDEPAGEKPADAPKG